MSKIKTLESVIWNISDGGMTFSILERKDFRTPVGEEVERINRRWIFEVKFKSFGSGTTYSFPLTSVMVGWLQDALTRVKESMDSPQECPTDGIEYGFRQSNRGTVIVRAGKRVVNRFDWTKDGLKDKPKPCYASESQEESVD